MCLYCNVPDVHVLLNGSGYIFTHIVLSFQLWWSVMRELPVASVTFDLEGSNSTSPTSEFQRSSLKLLRTFMSNSIRFLLGTPSPTLLSVWSYWEVDGVCGDHRTLTWRHNLTTSQITFIDCWRNVLVSSSAIGLIVNRRHSSVLEEVGPVNIHIYCHKHSLLRVMSCLLLCSWVTSGL